MPPIGSLSAKKSHGRDGQRQPWSRRRQLPGGTGIDESAIDSLTALPASYEWAVLAPVSMDWMSAGSVLSRLPSRSSVAVAGVPRQPLVDNAVPTLDGVASVDDDGCLHRVEFLIECSDLVPLGDDQRRGGVLEGRRERLAVRDGREPLAPVLGRDGVGGEDRCE